MNPKKGLTLLLLLLVPVGLLAADAPVRVAIFDGDGVGPSALPLIDTIEKATEHRFQISRITAAEIHGGVLANVDVLVHPGGSGGGQERALGEIGRKAVRDFVHQGGGYLGVCGGAYLATNDYEWSLNLIDAKVVDKRHWARGAGTSRQSSIRESSAFGFIGSGFVEFAGHAVAQEGPGFGKGHAHGGGSHAEAVGHRVGVLSARVATPDQVTALWGEFFQAEPQRFFTVRKDAGFGRFLSQRHDGRLARHIRPF
jgi:Biotin-protein ligase, N terminal